MILNEAQKYILKVALHICSKVLGEIKRKQLKPAGVAVMKNLEGCVQPLEHLTLG